MKPLLVFMAAAGLLLFYSCRKSSEGLSYPFVELNDCSSTRINGNSLQVCLDSFYDHRCPPNVMCIWGGYAMAKLRLSVSGQQHVVKLSTLGHSPIPMLPGSDTVVAGYTVRLVEVSPNTNPGTPYVKLEITQ